MNIISYIEALSSRGKYYFTEVEALCASGLSRIALRSALRRLKKKGKIAAPLRGYYLIIPPEYYSLESLPPDQFIHDLMQYLNLPYYVGLLSAAVFYGASHQQPQVFQVVVSHARRDIEVGRVKIAFIARNNATEMPVRQFNTPRGFINVASPEAIVVDLLTYPQYSGGISQSFTVLAEISDQLNKDEIIKVLQLIKKVPVIQRLGYFFELLKLNAFAEVCENEIRKQDYIRWIRLDSQSGLDRMECNERWKVIININLEADFDS
jgi:predicted transcriptional regulator of viral defense system